MDGKEYDYVFTDEDGKQTPIAMCRILEDKRMVEMRAKPRLVMPEKPAKANSPPKNGKKS
jgi:hypothetical protein